MRGLAADVGDPDLEVGERGDRRPAHLGAGEPSQRTPRPHQLAAEEQVLGDVAVVGEGEVLVHGGDAGRLRRRRRGEADLLAVELEVTAVGVRAPHSILTSVDLPAPLSPTMAVTVPAGNSIDTSRTAATPP